MARQRTVRGKMPAYVQVYDNFLEHPFPEGGCPIMNMTVDADDMHPLLRSKVGDVVLNWKDRLVQLIGIGKINYRKLVLNSVEKLIKEL